MRLRGTTDRWLGLVLVLVCAGSLAADEPKQPASAEEIAQLIDQLGTDYPVATRDAAAKRLIEIGDDAKQQLTQAVEQKNVTIRRRARMILLALERRSTQKKLDRYQAFIGGDPNVKLPGWPGFSRIFGDDAVCRQVFVEMFRAEPELLTAYEQSPEQVAALFQRRLTSYAELVPVAQQFRHTPAPPPIARELADHLPGSVLVFFLIIGNEKVAVSEELHELFGKVTTYAEPQYSLTKILNPIFGRKETQFAGWGARRQEKQDPQFQAKYDHFHTKLFNRWLRRDFVDNSPTNKRRIQRRILAAVENDSQEELPFLLKLTQAGKWDIETEATALLAIANVGDRGQLKSIEPLLKRDDVLFESKTANPSGAIECQIRDVALGVLIYLTKQKFEDYGFESEHIVLKMRGKFNGKMYDPRQLYFRDPQQRKQALAKWDAWSKEHLGQAADGHD